MNTTMLLDPDDTVEGRHEQRRQAARQRWPEFPAADLETRSGFLVDKGSGLLFKPVSHVVFARHVEVAPGAAIAGFYNSGSQLHFFERASNPGTLGELEAQEAARANHEREREQAHRAFVASQPRRILRLCDVDDDWEMPTVREAARLLLDHSC